MSITAESVPSGPLTVEEEETLFEANGIVFHFETPTSTWTDCGTGAIQLLKDRSTRRVRFFSQRLSTKEVTGNHLVPFASDTRFRPNKRYEERSWIWSAKSDYSNNTGVPREEVFAVRFKTGADAQAFKAAFEYAQRNNLEIEQIAGGTAQLPATRSPMEAFAMTGEAVGTAALGTNSEVHRNHGLGAESVTLRERRDDIGPA